MALGNKIYFTTMLGITYVVDADAKVLDESALLAINDLGPSGETWSLNTPELQQRTDLPSQPERAWWRSGAKPESNRNRS